MLKEKSETFKDYLYQLASSLENAIRIGSEKDEPEGDRYIQISDTLATLTAERLKRIADNIE